MLPSFRTDGYLPEGVHFASEGEILFRFGSTSARRRRLALRLRRWIQLAKELNIVRFLVDGSFVTNKFDPHDTDAVVLLPVGYRDLVHQGLDSALELEQMLLTRRPEELFAAEDASDWNDWVEFFSRTRELDGRRKGLVEVQL